MFTLKVISNHLFAANTLRKYLCITYSVPVPFLGGWVHFLMLKNLLSSKIKLAKLS